MFDSPLMRGLRRFPALVCALLLLTAASASAQDFVRLWPNGLTGTIDALAEAVTITNARGMATLGIQVTGTFSGTLAPECTVDGTNYTAFPVAAIADPGTTATTITAAGVYTGSIAGCAGVRVVATAWTSGAAVVTANSVQVSPGTTATANLSLESAELTVGAQPASDPHFIRCSNSSAAAPCQVEGPAASDAAVSGNPLLGGARASTATPSAVSADGDAVALWATRTGALNVADGGSTLSVDDGASSLTVDGTVTVTDGAGALNVIVDSSALPSGAATAAKQPALGTAGTASSDVITVQGVASMTPILATLSGTNSVRLQDGSGTGITSSTNSGSQALNVVVYDNAGNAVTSFGGSGGTASAFGSTFPSGASSGTAAGFSDGTNMQAGRVFDLDSGAGTQYGLGVNLRISGSGGSTEAAAGNGTASGALRVTLASDSTGIVAVASIAAGDTNIGNVDLASAIPAGTNNIGDVDVATIAAGDNNIGNVDVASIAAGNNNIGDVDVATIAAGDNDIGNVDLEFAGTAASTGNGASGAQTMRVTLANDSTGVLASVGTVSTVTTVSTVSAVTAVTNLATIGTSVTPGTSAAHLGKAEDAAHASGDTGVAVFARRSDTAASSGGADGDYVTLNTDSSGKLWTNIFPASPAAGTYIPVRLTDASGFYTPVTPRTHDTALGTMTSVTAPLVFGRASASAPSNVSADDDAVAAWYLRNGSQVMNLAAGGTLITATSSSLNVACTTGCSGGAQYAEDDAHTTGDSFTMAGAIRRDTTPASSSGTAGDVSALNTDANGRLYTQSVLYDSSGAELTPATDYTHDTALGTITSVAGPMGVCRASQSAPSDVSADNDGSVIWCLRNGSPVMNLASGGTLISAGSGSASAALRVVIATDDPVNDAQVKLDANMVAHDAADAGNPLKLGYVATSSIVARTPVATGDRTDSIAGLDGVQIVRPHSNLEDRVSAVVGVTDGSSTSLVAAQGSGVRFCATTVIVSNSSATNVTVDLRDGTAGSVIATIPAAADMGGAVIPLQTPLCTSANTAMAMDPSASASTVTVTAIGFKTEL